jgi:hypothetical protein
MRRFVLYSMFLGLSTMLYAQSHVDALRYSQPSIGGTARSVAMGGAFGALGGDFSTLSTNPAGLGVYRGSEFTFTPEFYFNKTTSEYFGKEVEEGKFNFNISNLGYVSNFSKDNGILKAINFGIGFNRIANFNSNTIITGDNYNTSYGDYMAANANGYGLETFNSALFYDAEVVLYDSVYGFLLNDNVDDGYFDNNVNFIPTEQRIISNERGRINEWAFSLGFNLDDMFYFGGTFGVQPVYYESDNSWKEFEAGNNSFQYFNFRESLKVRGTGYTGKFGFIFKPIPALRLGAAFHLPVLYYLREEYSTSIWSRYINTTYYPIDGNGNDIDNLSSKYSITTPFKAIGSAAGVIGKFLIVSGDLEYIDYSSMRMHSSDYDLDGENENIRVIYKDAINLKLGSELRFDKVYLRGGFGYYGSPYALTEDNSDAYKLSYSTGIGIRDENFFFDIAYQYVGYNEKHFLYDVNIDNNYYSQVANIKSQSHRVMTTIGFRF